MSAKTYVTRITMHQLEINYLSSWGLTDNQIANVMGLKPQTIANTLHRVRRRLGFQTKTAMVRWHAMHDAEIMRHIGQPLSVAYPIGRPDE